MIEISVPDSFLTKAMVGPVFEWVYILMQKFVKKNLASADSHNGLQQNMMIRLQYAAAHGSG